MDAPFDFLPFSRCAATTLSVAAQRFWFLKEGRAINRTSHQIIQRSMQSVSFITVSITALPLHPLIIL